MSLYIMSCDAEGGGTDFVIVAADSAPQAVAFLADIDRTNIALVGECSSLTDIEFFLHTQYGGVATLATA